MDIETTIDKWLSLFEKELSNVGNQIKAGTIELQIIHSYCSLIKAMIEEYSTSILQLCNQGKELPAKVILRTLAELAIKFSWCMRDAYKAVSLFFVNCEKWSKSSLTEQQKYLKRADGCFGDVMIRHNLEISQVNIDRLNSVHSMPDNAELCKNLFGEKEGFYLASFMIRYIQI